MTEEKKGPLVRSYMAKEFLREKDGRVVAVGATEEEAQERFDKLNSVLMSVSNGESDVPNPAWLEARANALGLTIDEYQNLNVQGVWDVGELVATYGVNGVKKMVKQDREIKEGEEAWKAGR